MAGKKVLFSSCLLGENVRYDGGCNRMEERLFREIGEMCHVVSSCPECEGGLSTPRTPAEIVGPGGGGAVLDGYARVMCRDGEDVTGDFVRGAYLTLERCRDDGVLCAVLKERSPSCGSTYIYDGTFKQNLIVGEGVTTALLRKNGIEVYGEEQGEEILAWLQQM